MSDQDSKNPKTVSELIDDQHAALTAKTTQASHSQADTIQLKLTPERAQLLFNRIVSARNGLRGGIGSGCLGDIGYFFGWLDALLTEVAEAMPPRCRLPLAKDDRQRVGGGGKPV